MNQNKIILGCMRLASKSHEEAKVIIQTALDAGIHVFDHADIYGRGESERVFAKAISDLGVKREDIILQSKVSIRPELGIYDLSYEHIIESVDKILERLDTDYLDVLLLHRPDALMEPQEIAKAFDLLHREGKVKSFGVSNFNNYQIELLNHYLNFPIAYNQVQFGLLHSVLVDEGINVNLNAKEAHVRAGGILEYSMIHNIKLQAWSPFQHGFIAGPFIDNPDYEAVNNALETVAQKYEVSKTTIAAAWILRHPANIQVVSGSMTPSRIIEVAKAQDIYLSRQEWYTLYKSTGKLLP